MLASALGRSLRQHGFGMRFTHSFAATTAYYCGTESTDSTEAPRRNENRSLSNRAYGPLAQGNCCCGWYSGRHHHRNEHGRPKHGMVLRFSGFAHRALIMAFGFLAERWAPSIRFSDFGATLALPMQRLRARSRARASARELL